VKCRNCGTEIADKAIVCYRCGVGTTEPVRRPAPLPTRGGGGPSLLAGIIPLLLALVLLAGAQASGYPREAEIAAAVLGAAGVLMLITRVMRRR
jgi:hypothetical protein